MSDETSANRMRSGADAIRADNSMPLRFRESLHAWINDCSRQIAAGRGGNDDWIAYDIASEYLRDFDTGRIP